MVASDPTYNLSALADRLIAEGRLEPLAWKIRRARELHSLSADVAIAIESLDALDVLTAAPTATEDFNKLVTESALLCNAIILYVRATKTASEERRGFDLISRFTPEEAETHRELCDLRDSAIAHFGSGGSYLGEWQAELAVLQFKGGVGKVGVVTRRKTADKALAKRMRPQLERTHALLRQLSLEKIQEVTDELNNAAREDENFSLEIHKHPLNLDVFLTSPDAGELARSSFTDGYGKGSATSP